MNIHHLEISHITDNIISQKTIEHYGVQFEEVAIESKFYDNVFKNRKIYSILKPEWEKIERIW